MSNEKKEIESIIFVTIISSVKGWDFLSLRYMQQYAWYLQYALWSIWKNKHGKYFGKMLACGWNKKTGRLQVSYWEPGAQLGKWETINGARKVGTPVKVQHNIQLQLRRCSFEMIVLFYSIALKYYFIFQFFICLS